MTPAVLREKQHVESVFHLVDTLPHEEEPLAHWARYLCVLTCGLFERCVRIILADYADVRAHPDIARYGKTHINRITNINEEKFRQILGSFNDKWRVAFEVDVTDAQKDAIDSILANRNNIAHGIPVGITMPRVREYYGRVTEVIEWLYDRCRSA